jgi:hypothetical protein
MLTKTIHASSVESLDEKVHNWIEHKCSESFTKIIDIEVKPYEDIAAGRKGVTKWYAVIKYGAA